jgi:hypothetical protein
MASDAAALPTRTLRLRPLPFLHRQAGRLVGLKLRIRGRLRVTEGNTTGEVLLEEASRVGEEPIWRRQIYVTLRDSSPLPAARGVGDVGGPAPNGSKELVGGPCIERRKHHRVERTRGGGLLHGGDGANQICSQHAHSRPGPLRAGERGEARSARGVEGGPTEITSGKGAGAAAAAEVGGGGGLISSEI